MHQQPLSRDKAVLAGLESPNALNKPGGKLQETFQEFVGETFFQLMLKSMRKMHGEPAYMHGGQGEEIFQGQLDQQLANDLARNAGAEFSNDLFHLFKLQLEQSDLASEQVGNASSANTNDQNTPRTLEDLQQSSSTKSSSVKGML